MVVVSTNEVDLNWIPFYVIGHESQNLVQRDVIHPLLAKIIKDKQTEIVQTAIANDEDYEIILENAIDHENFHESILDSLSDMGYTVFNLAHIAWSDSTHFEWNDLIEV